MLLPEEQRPFPLDVRDRVNGICGVDEGPDVRKVVCHKLHLKSHILLDGSPEGLVRQELALGLYFVGVHSGKAGLPVDAAVRNPGRGFQKSFSLEGELAVPFDVVHPVGDFVCER